MPQNANLQNNTNWNSNETAVQTNTPQRPARTRPCSRDSHNAQDSNRNSPYTTVMYTRPCGLLHCAHGDTAHGFSKFRNKRAPKLICWPAARPWQFQKKNEDESLLFLCATKRKTFVYLLRKNDAFTLTVNQANRPKGFLETLRSEIWIHHAFTRRSQGVYFKFRVLIQTMQYCLSALRKN